MSAKYQTATKLLLTNHYWAYISLGTSVWATGLLHRWITDFKSLEQFLSEDASDMTPDLLS